MESKLLKIRMASDSKEKVTALVDYMRANIDQPFSEMTQKGYLWDSVFWESTPEAEYLYIVIKSADFAKIMRDETELVATPFRAIYERFRSSCWTSAGYVELAPVFCFNAAMHFSNGNAVESRAGI